MRLEYEPQRNLLLLTVEDVPPPAVSATVPGFVDMAAGGRLVGVEARLEAARGDPALALSHWLAHDAVGLDAGTLYIELTSGPDDDQTRSVAVELVYECNAAGRVIAIGIPRRGAGYEISYPSGNR